MYSVNDITEDYCMFIIKWHLDGLERALSIGRLIIVSPGWTVLKFSCPGSPFM